MSAVWAWLEQTRPATAIAEGAYAFPVLETLHVVGLALVLGSIATFDLRILGWAGRTRTTAELFRDILPWTWIGFTVAIVTGFAMFASSATTYVENKVFLVKMALLLVAGVNVLFFHFHPQRKVLAAEQAVPGLLRASAGLSLTLWITIVVLGRWIGFV